MIIKIYKRITCYHAYCCIVILIAILHLLLQQAHGNALMNGTLHDNPQIRDNLQDSTLHNHNSQSTNAQNNSKQNNNSQNVIVHNRWRGRSQQGKTKILRSHSHHSNISPHDVASGNLFMLRIDFRYTGDAMNLPLALKSYDSDLNIKPPLGKIISSQINIDLPQATLTDIANALKAQTNGVVELFLDDHDHSLRLNFNNSLDIGRDAIKESLRWQNGLGSPRPILQDDGVVRFPYGEYQPVITCEPLNLCDIELEAKERVQAILIGDSLRWNSDDKTIPIVYSGDNDNLTAHLVLKPSEAGLSTTLMVTTSKRTYVIKLKSSSTNYVVRSGFYYPRQLLNTFAAKLTNLQRSSTAAIDSAPTMLESNNVNSIATSSNHAPAATLVNLNNIDYDYTITGSNYSWRPAKVFDDGISVYIQMPNTIDAKDLPGVCVNVGDSKDSCELVNFRYNNHFYIVDKLFDKATLINGFGDNKQTITISHNKASLWHKMFD